MLFKLIPEVSNIRAIKIQIRKKKLDLEICRKLLEMLEKKAAH